MIHWDVQKGQPLSHWANWLGRFEKINQKHNPYCRIDVSFFHQLHKCLFCPLTLPVPQHQGEFCWHRKHYGQRQSCSKNTTALAKHLNKATKKTIAITVELWMDALFPDPFLQQPQSEKFDTRLIVKIFQQALLASGKRWMMEEQKEGRLQNCLWKL